MILILTNQIDKLVFQLLILELPLEFYLGIDIWI